MKVVVGASSFSESSDKAINLLLEKKIEVVKNPYKRRMTEEEIIGHLAGADGLLAGLEPLNENVFSQASRLKAVARIGIGMDNVDIKAADKYGIKVSNTPDGPTNAVAEMTLTVLLSILHNLIPANSDVHNGVWSKRMGRSISSMKILIIGYGHIGQAVAELFEKMGAQVFIYDRYYLENSTVSLEEGLAQADVISLHASGRNLILGRAEIDKISDGTIILNSARGDLIDEDALYDALRSNRISAFWGDALWQEPYSGKICQCDNAILTPHICTYTEECRESMEIQAVKNLLKDLGF